MKKRAKFHMALIFVTLFAVVSVIYFYLPSILGDTTYPLKYSAEISAAAKENNISPAFLAGLIMAESGYNERSTSHMGAMGLVQMMPGTARTVARELGMTGGYDLYDGPTSIKLGARHIRDLFDRYNTLTPENQKRAVLVGYNAGTGTADAWVRGGMNRKVLSRGVNSYIDKIIRYEQIYEMMYPEELGILEQVTFQKVAVPQERDYRRQFWVDLLSRSLSLKF